MARASYEAFRCADQAWREEPRATRSRRNGACRRLQPPREPSPRKPAQGDLTGKPGEKWVRHRRSKGRSKSRASLVEGRRLGPGKASPFSRRRGGSGLGCPHRIGPRAPRKCAHRYRVRIATEASEARSPPRVGGTKRPHEARGIRRSDAERREALSSPARWVASHRDHARRRVGDAEPGTDRVRVLVVRVVGSREPAIRISIPFGG